MIRPSRDASRTRRSASARLSTLPTAWTYPDASSRTRSGAQATPFDTTHGVPDASASLTINPQLSHVLGTATQSAAASARDMPDWLRKPHQLTRTPARSAAVRVSAISSPLPAIATTTLAPRRAAAEMTSAGRLRSMNFPANSTRKSSGLAPSSRRAVSRSVLRFRRADAAAKYSLSTACGESKINGAGTWKCRRYSRMRVPTLRKPSNFDNAIRVLTAQRYRLSPCGALRRLLSPRYRTGIFARRHAAIART